MKDAFDDVRINIVRTGIRRDGYAVRILGLKLGAHRRKTLASKTRPDKFTGWLPRYLASRISNLINLKRSLLLAADMRRRRGAV
jgi:hypothetical protein